MALFTFPVLRHDPLPERRHREASPDARRSRASLRKSVSRHSAVSRFPRRPAESASRSGVDVVKNYFGDSSES
jgi:hypothetical protein